MNTTLQIKFTNHETETIKDVSGYTVAGNQLIIKKQVDGHDKIVAIYNYDYIVRISELNLEPVADKNDAERESVNKELRDFNEFLDWLFSKK